MELAEFLTHFEGVKRSGAGYKALCPHHSDKKASLCISQGKKGIVMKCQCGCDNNDILKEVCLDMTDLYPNTQQQKKEKYYNEKTAREFLKTVPDVTDVYDYKDEKGNLIYFKLRKKDKTFWFVRYIDNKIIWGLSEGVYYETYDGSNSYSLTKRNTKYIDMPKTEKILYNLPNLKNKLAYGDTVFIVEGEKDANTMTKLGLVATTAPTGGGNGDNKWNSKYNEYFKGADVVILPDNDKPGEEFAQLVERNLLTVAFKIRTVVVCNKEKGDVTDWYEDLADKMQARELLLEMVNDENVKVKTPKWITVTQKGDYKVNKSKLASHLSKVLHLEYVGNGQTSKKPIPHIYHEGVYEPCVDILGEIKKYINPNLDPNPSFLRDIEEFIKMEKRVIDANKMDGDINIINFKNGLYDIRTGKLKPHTPEYKCIFQIEHDYVEAAINHGYLDRYIADLSSYKEENARILQEFAGVCISNIPGHFLKTALFLYGKGNTGKGKFWEIIKRIVGARMTTTATLQDLTNKNSAHTTSLLYCKRLVTSGDLDAAAFKSVDIFKCLTGGDKIAINMKYGDQFEYLFNGIYAASMNKLPAITQDFGTHVFQRFTILPCNNVIPEEKRKKNLVEDIVEHDGDYFIQWALEGLRRVITNNFSFSYCKDVEDVRKEYELITDSVTAFVNHYCVFTDNKKDSIAWKEFKEDYQNWCIEEGREFVRRNDEIISRLEKIGIVHKKIKGIYTLKSSKGGGVRQRGQKEYEEELQEELDQEEKEQEKQEKIEQQKEQKEIVEKECTCEKPEYEQEIMFENRYSCNVKESLVNEDIEESNFPDEIPF